MSIVDVSTNATGADVYRPLRRPDFGRRVVTILGLPFDAIDLGTAVERIRLAVAERRRCFLSTPNVNFAIAAQKDEQFRSSVMRSDMSLVDGMPLVWIARLLGLPIVERVSGADLFDALRMHEGPPLSVFIVGGPPGSAETACLNINAHAGGLRCVGFDSAGFGDVSSLSSSTLIDRINAMEPDMIVVALGAAKGQAWIEHNAPRLNAPVLTHLGAAVNFMSGQLKRAPRWMRRSGLEWTWRIFSEPALWRRYASDGIALARCLLKGVIPDAMFNRLSGQPVGKRDFSLVITKHPSVILALHGAWLDDLDSLRSVLQDASTRDTPVLVDLSSTTRLGSQCIGLLLIAQGWFGDTSKFAVAGASRRLRRQLVRHFAEGLLQ